MGRNSPAVRMTRDTIIQSRQAAQESMTPTMRKEAASFEKFYLGGIKDTLNFYYAVGERVSKIAKNPKCKTEESQDSIQLLASFIGVSKGTLGETQRFAESYTKTDFNKLIKQVDSETGFSLKWGHARLLASVEDKSKRDALAAEALKNVWTPDILSEKIQKKLGKRSSGGRPLGKPASLNASLHQMKKLTVDWLRRNEEVWRAQDADVMADLLNTPPDKYTEEMLEELTQIYQALVKMNEVSQSDAKAAQRVIEHVRASLKKQPKGSGIDGSSRTKGAKSKKSTPARQAKNKQGKGRGKSAAARAARAAKR